MHVQSLFFSKICESGPDIYDSDTSEAASRKLGLSNWFSSSKPWIHLKSIYLSQIKQPHEKSFTAQTGTQINPRDLPR